jgi:hypothetical protein
MTIPPRAKAAPPLFPLFFASAIFGVKEKPTEGEKLRGRKIEHG